MNFYFVIAKILEDRWGPDHLECMQTMFNAMYSFLESNYFEEDSLRDTAIDELIEYLKSKKSKPKDNGHA